MSKLDNMNFIPKSQRAVNRFREHGSLTVIDSQANRHLFKCVNPACNCGADSTQTRWSGWLTIGVDIVNKG